MTVSGHAPDSLGRRAVFEAAVEHLDLDEALLERLSDVVEGKASADPADCDGLLGLLEHLVGLADRVEIG